MTSTHNISKFFNFLTKNSTTNDQKMSTKRSIFTFLAFVFTVSLLARSSDAVKDKATGIKFPDKANGLPVFGVGVRTKGPIKVYSVACYGHKSVKSALGQLSATEDKKKALDTLLSGTKKGPVTFLLNFKMGVGAEKVSSSIADAISSRHKGAKDVAQLKQILCDGVSEKGSTAKGTTMQFDCTKGGVKVFLDGKNLGSVSSGGLGAAFCGAYLDGKSVSPALRQNCIDSCCGP